MMNKIGIKKNWFVLFVIFLFLLQLLVMTAWGESIALWPFMIIWICSWHIIP